MIHVSCLVASANEGERKRLRRVMDNWKVVLKDFPKCWLEEKELPRGARDLGDSTNPPFVKDVIEIAFMRYPDHDSIFLTNADAHICSDFASAINISNGAVCSRRRNFFKPVRNVLTIKQAEIRGRAFEGVDSFAISREWWKEHRETIPDMLMGRQGWDWVFKFSMDLLPVDLTYHEYHMPLWFNFKVALPGQLYNRKLSLAWWHEQKNKDEILAKWPELKDFEKDPAIPVKQEPQVQSKRRRPIGG